MLNSVTRVIFSIGFAPASIRKLAFFIVMADV